MTTGVFRSAVLFLCVQLLLALSGPTAARAMPTRVPDPQANNTQASAPLGANEIRRLLGGNTVMWNLGKVTQRQYLDPKGYTVFENENFVLDKGLWTVTRDGLFCSNWQQTGWTCYRLALDGGSLIWNGPISPFGSSEGERVVSRLVSGNQTTFSAPKGPHSDALVAEVTRALEASTLP